MDDIIEDSVLFSEAVGLQEAKGKRRASHKGQNIVNRRTYKTCPICLSPHKQVTRHIKRQHGELPLDQRQLIQELITITITGLGIDNFNFFP